MENIFRIAFWTIALSGTLQAGGNPLISSDITSHELFLRKYVVCPVEMRLYTMRPSHVNCLEAALECMISELNTTKDECDDKGEKIGEIMEILDKVIDLQKLTKVPRSNATVCVCEAAPSLPWDDFLTNMTDLLKQYASAISN